MKTKLCVIFVFIIFKVYSQRGLINNGANIIIKNGGIIGLYGNTIDYVNLNSGISDGTIDLDGKIKLQGDWYNNSPLNPVFKNLNSTGEVIFQGNLQQSINGFLTYFENLNINNTAGLSLNTDTKIKNEIKLTAGNLYLNDKNLVLDTSATITGSFSNSSMIIADSSGYIKKYFNNNTAYFTFPVGDNSGNPEYTPVSILFTDGTFQDSAFVLVNLKNTKHPENFSSSSYINRYWNIFSNNILNFSCNIELSYNDNDIVGIENDLFGVIWLTDHWGSLGQVDPALNLISSTVDILSDITAGEQSLFTPFNSYPVLDEDIQLYSYKNKIYLKLNSKEKKGQIKVYNLLGQEIMNKEINDYFNIYPVNCSSGIYIVKVLLNDRIKVKELYLGR